LLWHEPLNRVLTLMTVLCTVTANEPSLHVTVIVDVRCLFARCLFRETYFWTRLWQKLFVLPL